METLFSLENLFTLGMLILLQAVLGFDNLLYISIESKRVEPARQSSLRKLGIGLAVLLRILLLFALVKVIDLFREPLFGFDWKDVLEGQFNIHSLVVLFGGVFILYTAMKEILHMMVLEETGQEQKATRSFGTALFWIVTMNVVFSFDSILSAMALSDHFIVMATAIVIGGIMMIWLADEVSDFLQKNRMYEVVGLFILFLVGIMLISEGGHLAELKFFGFHVTPMSKTTFYFVIFVMVLVDVVQSRYRRKLDYLKMAQARIED